MSTDVGPILESLEGIGRSVDHARACLLGASQGTAPADRWEWAADHLTSASARLAAGLAALAAADKQEAYCTACGESALLAESGWVHWGATLRGPHASDHEPVVGWRTIVGVER